MDYKDTLTYLYSQLPMFTRDGPSAFKSDLTNTIALCTRSDNPQHKFKSVHVGGTNGKGSTSHMLAAVLQTAGYKTGLYTSPHLLDFRERIRVNGEMITEQQVVYFVAQHKTDFEEIQPSFFEMTVAMAFDHFARAKVDIAVIEVGLGGRLDSTNVITPLLSIITNIGWDHMNMLGNTLQLIAGEKAGIIKHNVPVIIGEYQPEVAAVFIAKAGEENAELEFASAEWDITEQQAVMAKAGVKEYLELRVQSRYSPLTVYNLRLDLTGSYQLRNVLGVLSAVADLQEQGFDISTAHVETALSRVKELTGLHGRWEVLNNDPLTICDTGHNPDGISEVLKNIEDIAYDQLHFVIGMVNDKDLSKILPMLPADAIYYFCKPDIPRGLDAGNLKQKAESFGLHGDVYQSVKAALEAANANAGKNDLIFAGGSTFVVAEVVAPPNPPL